MLRKWKSGCHTTTTTKWKLIYKTNKKNQTSTKNTSNKVNYNFRAYKCKHTCKKLKKIAKKLFDSLKMESRKPKNSLWKLLKAYFWNILPHLKFKIIRQAFFPIKFTQKSSKFSKAHERFEKISSVLVGNWWKKLTKAHLWKLTRNFL